MRYRHLACLLAAFVAFPATTARAQYVVWLDTHFSTPVLRRAGPTFVGITSLNLPAGSLPEGLALARYTGQLVWTQAVWSNAGLQKGPLTLGSFAPLAGGLSVLHGIAENPADGRLYFTSSNLTQAASVYRCEADGSGRTTLISYGAARNLRGIAVDGAAGKLFFADFANAGIFSANLDGTGVTQIANLAGGSGPWGVAVDPAAQRLYWCEYGSGRIVSSTYTGGSPAILFTGLTNPTYLALDPAGGNLYWSEAGGTPRVRMGPIAGGSPGVATVVTQSYGGVAFVPASAVDVPIADVVREVELAPVSPNPARAGGMIAFALPRDADVRLTLTDVQGRVVATLADGVRAAGRHRVALPGRSHGLAAGVYFVRLHTPDVTLARRIALVP